MSANALRHVVRQKTHRERSQPLARQARFGLLEKHKDYKLRAINYHQKQDAIKTLKEKASFRNADEFYMNMNKTKTKNGVHVLERKNALAPRTVKMMKAQDMAYLQSQQSTDARRIEKAKQNMHFLMGDEEEEDEEDAEESRFADDSDEEDAPPRKKSKAANAAIRSKHVIFVDDAASVKSFTPSTYFQTAPELVGRTYNRLRADQLSAPVLVNNTQDQILAHRAAVQTAPKHGQTAAQASSASNKAVAQAHAMQARADQGLLAGYTEIASRLARKRKLTDAVTKLQTEKNLAGKGARKTIQPKEDRFGEIDEKKVAYKWKLDRKR